MEPKTVDLEVEGALTVKVGTIAEAVVDFLAAVVRVVQVVMIKVVAVGPTILETTS